MLKFVFLKAYAGTGMLDLEIYTTLRELLISIDPTRSDYHYFKCREAFRQNQPYLCGNYIIIKKSLNHNRNGQSK